MTDYTALADQINEAHKEIVKSFTGSLEHAIKAGEWLTIVQENLKAEHSNIKSKDWLKDHCPDISQRTANLYKQVAQHKHLFKKTGNTVASLRRDDHDLSLRDALKLIPKDPKRVAARAAAKAAMEANKAAEVAKAAEAGKAAVVQEPAAHGPTIEDMLNNMAPDELFTAVTATWEDDQVAKLALLLADHMRSLKQAGDATASPPPIPSVQSERRV
jgi:hypothetical protein